MTSAFRAGIVVFCLIFLLPGKAECDTLKDHEIALAKGQYEIELRNYGPAIAYLKKALELKPGEHGAMLALGIAYSRNEEYGPAKELLQKVYSEDPTNTRSRYELGVVLAHLKEYGEANRLLATVTAAVATAELADNAKELMEGMTPSKKGEKPALKVVGGLQYDSNVILEPDNPFIPQDRKSDWRSILSVYGSYPFRTTERSGFEANYQFYQNLHYELEDYNVQQHDISLAGRYAFSPGTQATLQAGYVTSYVGGERYSSLAAVRPVLSLVLMEKSRTQFSAGWEDRKYLNSGDFPTNSDRSGAAATAGVSHTQMFTKETSVVFEYGYEQDLAEKANWDATGHKLSCTARSQFGGYSVFANAAVSDWKYGPSPVPFSPDRHDRRWEGTVGVFRDLSRTVRVSLADQYMVNDSNLDLYTYRRDIVGLFVEIRL
ncbi:MAG: tetratricopeptide repeat protein [Nitrospirota bacterium]